MPVPPLRATPSNTVTREGGYIALVGYLFQFIGSGAYLAEIVSQVDDTDDGGFATALYFEVEQYGQDAVNTLTPVAGTKRRQFIQFKFSLDPANNPIQPAELAEITETFRASERTANQLLALPAEFILRTNRPLSPDSTEAKAAADKVEPCRVLDEKVTPANPKTKTPTQREPRDPDFRAMLKLLKYDLVNHADAEMKLKEYAKTFGINQPTELTSAIDRVISLILRKAVSPHPRTISAVELADELTGINNAKSLLIGSLAPRLLEELMRQRYERLGIPPTEVIEDREGLKGLSNLTNEAVVVFVGGGGCGKSSLMWQVFKKALIESPKAKTLAAAIFAGEPIARSVGELIASWRTEGNPARAILGDSPESAISRLCDANSSTSLPILFLGLDGIDEIAKNAPQHPKIFETISYFWNLHQRQGDIPAARLFLTCRTKNDLAPYIHTRGFGPVGRPPVFVEIDDFTDAEFERICQKVLSPDIAAGLAASSNEGNPFTPIPDQLISDGPKQPSPIQVSEPVSQALHHPTIWRLFTRLTRIQQKSFLQGDQAVSNLLWRGYLTWFCDKAEIRSMMDPVDSQLMLASAAKHCRTSEDSYRRQDDWIVPLMHDTQCGQPPAFKFYSEALAAGIIVKVAGRPGGATEPNWWMWRHAPFWEYLCTL